MKVFIVLIGSCLIMSLTACKKDTYNRSGDAILHISTDTINFDTVFTTAGSVTHYFKIFNLNDQKLVLSNVALSGGENSLFSMNVNGIAGTEISNVEIEANDSVYVFVTVLVDPSVANLPFVVQDSISVAYNGNTRWVQLQAWGQNAHFLKEKVIVSDTTWTNDKPIVIVGGVLVAEGVELNITQGTKIYLHADAPFIVDGTLKATGKKYDSTKIFFQGDRLDDYYRDLPASWPGIYFRERSKQNLLKHVVLKNAYQGIVSDQLSTDGNPKVRLEETVIENCYDVGILAVNSSVEAVNSVVSNCGKNILLVHGGNYSFTHCTNVAISNSYIAHRQPVLAIADFIKLGEVVHVSEMKATFTNCIFWGANGTVDNEVVIVREGDELFEVTMKNCLWKVKEQPTDAVLTDMIESQDPLFLNTDTRSNVYDFRLKEGSPAINAGISAGILTDLNGVNRVNIPDIGAFETTF